MPAQGRASGGDVAAGSPHAKRGDDDKR